MTLIDTNVLLDILANDPLWSEWSGQQLAQRAALGPLVINDVIYAEVSVRMESQAELERAVARLEVRLLSVRFFLRGKVIGIIDHLEESDPEPCPIFLSAHMRKSSAARSLRAMSAATALISPTSS